VSQLGYNVFNKEKLKLHLGIGGAINYSVYLDNVFLTQVLTRSDGKVVVSTRREEQYKLSPFWIAVPLRTGLTLNQKTDISLLYSFPSGLTQDPQYVGYSYTRSSLQLNVNYLFKRK
jgi:hypothetical protein